MLLMKTEMRSGRQPAVHGAAVGVVRLAKGGAVMGRKKDAALKGRLYTRKKKKEGELPFGFAQGKKSCPYTEGKSTGLTSRPCTAIAKSRSLAVPARSMRARDGRGRFFRNLSG